MKQPVIVFTAGPLEGRRFELNLGVLTLGRTDSSSGLTIPDDTLSRTHSRLEVDRDGCLFVSDCRSKNGTKVNGERISRHTRLSKGDEVILGKSAFRVVYSADSISEGQDKADTSGGKQSDPTQTLDSAAGRAIFVQGKQVQGADMMPLGTSMPTIMPDGSGQDPRPGSTDADHAPDPGQFRTFATIPGSPEDLMPPYQIDQTMDFGLKEEEGHEEVSTPLLSPKAMFMAVLLLGLVIAGVAYKRHIRKPPPIEKTEFSNDFCTVCKPPGWLSEPLKDGSNGYMFQTSDRTAFVVMQTTADEANRFAVLDVNPETLKWETRELLGHCKIPLEGFQVTRKPEGKPAGDRDMGKLLFGRFPYVSWDFKIVGYEGTCRLFYSYDVKFLFAALYKSTSSENIKEYIRNVREYVAFKFNYGDARFDRPVVNTKDIWVLPLEKKKEAERSIQKAKELWERRDQDPISNVLNAIELFRKACKIEAGLVPEEDWSIFGECLEERRRQLYHLQGEISRLEALGKLETARDLCDKLMNRASRRVEAYMKAWACNEKKKLGEHK